MTPEPDPPELDNPVFAAIDDLQDFNTEWIQTHPKTAERGFERRLRQLRLAVTAAAELLNRDEDPTPAAIREEMGRMHDEFVFWPGLLLDLAHQLHLEEDPEDLERAHTVERAYYWMAFTLADQPADQFS